MPWLTPWLNAACSLPVTEYGRLFLIAQCYLKICFLLLAEFLLWSVRSIVSFPAGSSKCLSTTQTAVPPNRLHQAFMNTPMFLATHTPLFRSNCCCFCIQIVTWTLAEQLSISVAVSSSENKVEFREAMEWGSINTTWKINGCKRRNKVQTHHPQQSRGNCEAVKRGKRPKQRHWKGRK